MRKILEELLAGGLTVDQAQEQIVQGYVSELGHTTVDHLREQTQGHQEVIYCASKTGAQIAEIVTHMLAHGGENILLTRADAQKYEAVRAVDATAVFHEAAQVIVANPKVMEQPFGCIAVICAGTSDVGVAEEAAITAELMGNRVRRIYDVGVAGLHRLLGRMPELREANVIVAVAGMEGALPSVVKGLVKCPVIAVPTSVGYGASLGGIAALLAMLNSCATGISVVNIDNGFGAGYQAALINQVNRHE